MGPPHCKKDRTKRPAPTQCSHSHTVQHRRRALMFPPLPFSSSSPSFPPARASVARTGVMTCPAVAASSPPIMTTPPAACVAIGATPRMPGMAPKHYTRD